MSYVPGSPSGKVSLGLKREDGEADDDRGSQEESLKRLNEIVDGRFCQGQSRPPNIRQLLVSEFHDTFANQKP
jgi:hypothetical protein